MLIVVSIISAMGKIVKLKLKHHPVYKAYGSIWCPAVKDNVVFNRYGWIHFTHDGDGHRRSSTVITMRLLLIPLIGDVIKNSKVIIEETDGEISMNGKKRKVKYFEIACEVGLAKKHVTVILRKIEAGNLHYLSVRYTDHKTKKALLGLS